MSTAKLASQIASLQARLSDARTREEQVIGAALLQIIRTNPGAADGVVTLMKSSNVNVRAIKIIVGHIDSAGHNTKEAGSEDVSHPLPAPAGGVPVATLPQNQNDTRSAE